MTFLYFRNISAIVAFQPRAAILYWELVLTRLLLSLATLGFLLAVSASLPTFTVAGATTAFPIRALSSLEEEAWASVGPSDETSAPLVDELELALFELTNRDRVNSGLAILQFDYELLEMARARAGAQVRETVLSHYDASGRLVFVDTIDALGVRYQSIGENLARVDPPGGTAAFRAEGALMASPSHRTNILEPTFQNLAVGVSTDGEGRVIFAQIFRSGG